MLDRLAGGIRRAAVDGALRDQFENDCPGVRADVHPSRRLDRRFMFVYEPGFLRTHVDVAGA